MSITAKYRGFLARQNSAVIRNALNATKDVGSVWYGPDNVGSRRPRAASRLPFLPPRYAIPWGDQHHSCGP
ncbi:hypothetical protein OG21DRAFT_1506929, partial [Imleria badia]